MEKTVSRHFLMKKVLSINWHQKVLSTQQQSDRLDFAAFPLILGEQSIHDIGTLTGSSYTKIAKNTIFTHFLHSSPPSLESNMLKIDSTLNSRGLPTRTKNIGCTVFNSPVIGLHKNWVSRSIQQSYINQLVCLTKSELETDSTQFDPKNSFLPFTGSPCSKGDIMKTG